MRAESQHKLRTRFETKFQLDWSSDRDGHMWQTSKTTPFGWRTKEPPKRGLKVIIRVRERGVGEARTQMSRSQVSFLLKVWSINQQRQYHLES